MAKVSVQRVTKIYPGEKGRDVTAVNDLTFEARDRELLVLVGPSGCGKTTTLRMIAGLENVSGGDIFIADRRVNEVPPKDRDIAMVFQHDALFPHLSVRDNLAFGLKLRKYAKPEIDRRVADAAEILSISDLLDRKPKALSGGQRQRVAVGRAIVGQPKVFLFDEPLSNLDAKLRVQMRAEITKLHERLQATMIYVTHDQVEAMTMGDRIVVMNDGVVQQIDTPVALYNNPVNRFVAGFLGTPPMNFLSGTLKQDRDSVLFQESNDGTAAVHFALEQVAAVRELVGKPVILGVRPEHISVAVPTGDKQSDRAIFPALVDMVERLGSETNLYLQTGAHTVVCRTAPGFEEADSGRRMRFKIEPAKVHFFDPVLTTRIT
jgi:multiple sugar transport system ATP-binding protein